MRKAILLLVALGVAGVLVLLVMGATSERREAFTLGVTAAGAVAELDGGEEVCQGPIRVPDSSAHFDAVRLVLGTYRKPGPAVDVTLEPERGGAPLARAHVDAGYPDITGKPSHVLDVGEFDSDRPFRVCVRNAGPGKLGVYGNGDAASRTSTAEIDGKPAGVDLTISFERSEPRSSLSLLGATLSRASLWHTSWAGTWTMVLLALVVVAGVPALLAFALRRTADGD
jgi:hypothetical protein